jgi:CubicO group peptidase (beta-lactamase class C family)
MSESPPIQGVCDPRFESVKKTFEEGFRSREEIGAALAVTLDGEPILDLWGGYADPARTRPWAENTIANVYSSTKGIVAICALQLAERDRLDLDAPVSKYWSEFAQNGKSGIPVRWLLSHRAGLVAIREMLPTEALYDWDAMVDALAAEAPWWTPGEGHGYHLLTYGWLIGEVIRRITGRSVGTYLREEIAEPLGVDFHIGLDGTEHGRAAELSATSPDGIEAEAIELMQMALREPEGMHARAFMNPPALALGPNRPEWRSAEIPGANGHGSARALARIYGALARGGDLGGVHLLSPDSLERCYTEQSFGPDRLLLVTTRFSLGFMLSQDRPATRFGPNARTFGHPGMGGSVGFADLDAKIGFGYVPNRMGPHILLDPRAIALIESLYACLD